MTEYKKTGVIVLGGHVQGYGIVRIYGENNIPSVVIDSTGRNIARHSKYCVGFYKSVYRELVSFLLDDKFREEFKNWLIIPTDDYYVRLLSQNHDELSRFYKVSVDKWASIEYFFNKRRSYPLAEEAGVPIPKTFYPNSIDDLNDISGKIIYPCIIKPAVMLDFYRHFKKKVFVCNNFDELKANFSKSLELIKADEILIQEIIPGNNENQYSVGIFFDSDKSYNYVVGRRARQHPIDFGNATTFAETVENPLLVEYAHNILSKAGYFGIAEVEFKFDEKDNKFKFLEVNPRTWKWHLIAKASGIPILMSLYNYFYEGSPITKKDYEKASWRDVVTDLPITIKMKLKKIYKRPARNKLVSAVANCKDPLPLFYQMLYVPYNILKR